MERIMESAKPSQQEWEDMSTRLPEALRRTGGKPLGQGAYGVAVEIFQSRLDTFLRMLNVGTKNPEHRLRERITGPNLLEAPSHRPVAVKIQRYRSEDDLYSVVVETKLHAGLAPSRYWVPMHDAFVTDKGYFVSVMGVAPGIVLAEYLQVKPVTPNLFRNVERAVKALWMQGVVHRDLNANNVMIDVADESVTIIDFGMAIKLRVAPSPRAVNDDGWRRQLTEALDKLAGLENRRHAANTQLLDVLRYLAYVQR
jgi:serine/threonine protein kinase